MEFPPQETPAEQDFRLWLEGIPMPTSKTPKDPGIDAKEALKRKKIAAAKRKRKQQGIHPDIVHDVLFGHVKKNP